MKDRKERGTNKREQEKPEEKGETEEVGHDLLLCYVICPLGACLGPMAFGYVSLSLSLGRL